MSNKFDLIVIGSGPGGRRAAIQAAKLGKRALVIEKGHRVGGVSVHTGTIPSKTLRETVLNLSGWREREFYGRSYRVKQDITAQDLMQRLKLTLNHEVETLDFLLEIPVSGIPETGGLEVSIEPAPELLLNEWEIERFGTVSWRGGVQPASSPVGEDGGAEDGE